MDNVTNIEGYIPEPKERNQRYSGNMPRPGGDYEAEWNRCTKLAREYWLSFYRKKYQIAELAVSVCEIKWGGGNHWSKWKGIKTLRDFSKDTGISYKTLHVWVSVYLKVYQKVPKEIFDERNWAAAQRTYTRVQHLHDQNPDPKVVTEIYEHEKQRKGSESRIRICIKGLRCVKNHFKQIDWEKCKDEEIEELESLMVEMAEIYTGEKAEDYEAEETDPEILKIGEDFEIDLFRLIESRMLIQANSGGGKSWAIRKIVEQIGNSVPVILFDPEDEFGDLQSGFEYFKNVYADEDQGPVIVDRLLKGESSVINLYEVPPNERREVVRNCCEILLEIPKKDQRDCIIIIDEAHMFAPQRGKSASRDAVVDLACRGRKRGLCVILATQRLAKLHKDAAAECLNKMIGRTSLDIDILRSTDEINIPYAENCETMRNLDPGEFFVFGPAIGDDVDICKVGRPETIYVDENGDELES